MTCAGEWGRDEPTQLPLPPVESGGTPQHRRYSSRSPSKDMAGSPK